MVAARQERAARAELWRRQSGWFMLLALTARASKMGAHIEPQRQARLENGHALRIQKLYRRRKLLVRASALARSRRAWKKMVWILRLKLRAARKRGASDKLQDFLVSVKRQAAGVLALRAFQYRVVAAQRMWRKHAAITRAQIELITLQCMREEERRLGEELEEGEGEDGGPPPALPAGADRLPEDALRRSVTETLCERRRKRATLLHDYRTVSAHAMHADPARGACTHETRRAHWPACTAPGARTAARKAPHSVAATAVTVRSPCTRAESVGALGVLGDAPHPARREQAAQDVDLDGRAGDERAVRAPYGLRLRTRPVARDDDAARVATLAQP
jgi:hypothetical protein